MHSAQDEKDHGWTPANRNRTRSPHAADTGVAGESKWTRVSANVFVSAVLSGSRAPFVKAAPRSQGPGSEKPRWWRKLFPAKRTA